MVSDDGQHRSRLPAMKHRIAQPNAKRFTSIEQYRLRRVSPMDVVPGAGSIPARQPKGLALPRFVSHKKGFAKPKTVLRARTAEAVAGPRNHLNLLPIRWTAEHRL